MNNVNNMMQLIQDLKTKEMKQSVLEMHAQALAEPIKTVQRVQMTYEGGEDDEVEEREEREEEGGLSFFQKVGSLFRKGDASTGKMRMMAAPMSLAAPPSEELAAVPAAAPPVPAAPAAAKAVEPAKPSEPSKPQQQVAVDEAADELDVSLMPKLIESQLERFDEEGAVRPTIINLDQVKNGEEKCGFCCF